MIRDMLMHSYAYLRVSTTWNPILASMQLCMDMGAWKAMLTMPALPTTGIIKSFLLHNPYAQTDAMQTCNNTPFSHSGSNAL